MEIPGHARSKAKAEELGVNDGAKRALENLPLELTDRDPLKGQGHICSQPVDHPGVMTLSSHKGSVQCCFESEKQQQILLAVHLHQNELEPQLPRTDCEALSESVTARLHLQPPRLTRTSLHFPDELNVSFRRGYTVSWKRPVKGQQDGSEDSITGVVSLRPEFNSWTHKMPRANHFHKAACPLHVCRGTQHPYFHTGVTNNTHSHSNNGHLEIRKIKTNKAIVTHTM